MDRIYLKNRAKHILGNRIFGDAWLLALVAWLIVDGICSAAGTYTSGVGAILVTGPLYLGSATVFLQLIRSGKKINFKDLFVGFTKDLGQNILLGFLSSLFIALWSLLLIVPGIVKAYSYSMIYYIKVDHPDYDWKTCLHASQELTYGHKWELFVLDLSFLGWYIVGALCLGVGALWVRPYHETAKALFYEQLIGK